MPEGAIAEMLKRVKEKEAKRKAEHDEYEQRPTELQCEQEERIAVDQLKAYWKCFPLPTEETQDGQTRAEETSEEELIEDVWQDHWSSLGLGPSDDTNQELVIDKAEHSHQRVPEPDRLRRTNGGIRVNAKQVATKANNERRNYLAELRDRIKLEGEAVEAKRRTLDPLNSGDSPGALNGKVEPANLDLVHIRIKEEGQLPSFKRGLKLETLYAERPGSKFHKKEM